MPLFSNILKFTDWLKQIKHICKHKYQDICYKQFQKMQNNKTAVKDPQVKIPLKIPVKIISKLNKMVLTIGQGQNQSRPSQILSTLDHNLNRQKFTIFQTSSNSQSYFIEVLDGKDVISTKKWGDMEYENISAEKYVGGENQMWRIVPYDQAVQSKIMLDKKKSMNSPALYPSLSIEEKKSIKTFSFQNNQNIQQTSQKSSKIQQTTNEVQKSSGSIFRLGYDFPSGPNIGPITVSQPFHQELKSHSHLSSVSQLVQRQKQSQGSNNPYQLGYDFPSGNHLDTKSDARNTVGYHTQPIQNMQIYPVGNKPIRFPVKQKRNQKSFDYQNQGWFFIQNYKYGTVIQIEGGIDQNGMNIVLNKNYGNRNQLWRFQ